MRQVRLILLWVALALSAGLAGLSVIGSLPDALKRLGFDDPHAFFNSPLLIGLWGVLLFALAASIVLDPKILTRPFSLAMHLGPALVIIGAMVGSDIGIGIANKITGAKTVRSAEMVIFKGQASDELLGRRDNAYETIGKFPFRVRLDEFRTLYYPPKPWPLLYMLPSDNPDNSRWPQGKLDWVLGRELVVPGTDLHVKVLEYIPSACATYANGIAGRLVITTRDGNTVELPAQAGQEAKLAEPNVTVRIEQVYSRLQAISEGGTMRVVNDANSNENPGVSVSITPAEGERMTRYVLARTSMHKADAMGLQLTYVRNAATAVPDPATQRPAMKLEYWRPPGEPRQAWVIVDPLATFAGADAGDAHLVLAQPETPPMQWESHITLLEGDKEVGGGVVSVNHPLRVAGYDLYQQSYDREGGRYTVLGVVSTSGLTWVWVGFALLCVGVFGHFWIIPIVQRFRRPGDGN